MPDGPGSCGIGVVGAGGYLPERVRDNVEVAALTGASQSWILDRTGIRTRHVADPGQAASDLASRAADAALASAGLATDDIALIILATSTPDELGPSTACRVQAQLGARRAVAMDVSAACSGYLFGVRLAHDWLSARPGDGFAVVVGTEVYSKFLNYGDRGTAVLFGDGAGATVLGPVLPGTGFAGIEIGSDGSGAGHVLIPAGGSRCPADATTIAEQGHLVQMNGPAVRDFISEIFPRSVDHLLTVSGQQLSDIDLVVTHQPNPVLLRHLAQQMGITEQQLLIVADRVGNIGSACIPFALAEAAASGRIVAGDQLLLAAFGAGLTWGAALLRWSGTGQGMRALRHQQFGELPNVC
jgi:3-oxoacyl-(acyl-carrier-protein) synthase III